MTLRVIVEFRPGRSFEINEENGFTPSDLRAAFRIFRRGVSRGLVRNVRLVDGDEVLTG
ncbi:MAG: hypothetical protein ACYTDY_19080 [Planctomycetota bacterium]|jgi:hypothetical protein